MATMTKESLHLTQITTKTDMLEGTSLLGSMVYPAKVIWVQKVCQARLTL